MVIRRVITHEIPRETVTSFVGCYVLREWCNDIGALTTDASFASWLRNLVTVEYIETLLDAALASRGLQHVEHIASQYAGALLQMSTTTRYAFVFKYNTRIEEVLCV